MSKLDLSGNKIEDDLVQGSVVNANERAAVEASPRFSGRSAYIPGCRLIKARDLPNYSGWMRYENFGHNDSGYYNFTAHQVGELICISCGGEEYTTSPDADELIAPLDKSGSSAPLQKRQAGQESKGE